MFISIKVRILFLLFLGLAIWLFDFIKDETLILKNGKISSWSQAQVLDCAIVLTGGTSRVREGFDLLSQNKVRLLIISGVNKSAHLREIFPMWPFYPGISEEKLILERESSTTYSNAIQSLALVKSHNCKNAFLITSQIHMPRALRVFQSIFLDQIEITPHAVPAGAAEEELFNLLGELSKESIQKLLLRL